MKLRSTLDGCSSSQLALIATGWGLAVEAGTLRRELVAGLDAHIQARASDPTIWAGLSATERQIVGRVVLAGGRHEVDLLARRLGASVPADERARAVAATAARLVERGLLFRVFEADEQRRGVYLVLPDELLDVARAQFLDDGPVRESPGPVPAPERVARCDLAADLFVLASALRREAWGAASRGLARRPGRTVGQLVGRLAARPSDGPGAPGRRWRFLLWVAQRAGWISRDPWPMPDDLAVERLLAERSRLPAATLAAGPAGAEGGRVAMTERAAVGRRQADALHLLGELSSDAWWPAEEVVGWIVREADGEGAGGASAARAASQVGRWLAGRWFWLGLVEWGWDGAAWSRIRPTEELRLLDASQIPAERQVRACHLGDELDVEAPLDSHLAMLYRAERYLAYLGESDPGRRYRLTPASLARGVRLGGDPDELRGLLERLTEAPLPDAWTAAIRSWTEGPGRLTLAARLVLSSDSPETLDAALTRPAGRGAVVERLSPRDAVVAGDRVASLLADLAEAGLPVEIDPGLRAEPDDVGRSAALAGGVAETAWVALEVLRRLAPDAVAEQRDLRAARAQLDAVLATGTIEALSRRAATIAAAIADRRRQRPRRRLV